MKKRMICLLIVLVMIALVIITGCSQTSSINSSEPAVSSNQSAAQSQTVSSPAASQSQAAGDHFVLYLHRADCNPIQLTWLASVIQSR